MMMLPVLMVTLAAVGPGWSNEVSVRHGNEKVVRFQARIEGDYLLVKAVHQQGWHTYAMDNEARALAALAGKKSLGIEKGINITVVDGLELEGRWLQTKPSDLSKPELRWFSYGFDQTAWFARRVKQVTSDEVVLRVRGQACSGETCSEVNLTLKLQDARRGQEPEQESLASPLTNRLKEMVPVEFSEDQAPEKP